eukprot:CAMPEP_0172520762 /NCGR_PEP_ID=MMETSP1066-20121228/292191_1 /TAXON_ID=671091 /ORGANISM="Coscinodiscus wailesii, Strain CCMP2513" /LENGTH=348 /DNA_ID=CAMNT_0013303571 /DNA_START=135 /DNA_END=1181 /DNA_ORIENTATION=-
MRVLERFFASRKAIRADLKPILARIARKNTIIVMTVNFGQSALLMNFVCRAKSRGLDISNVLLFATDEESLGLAKSLGVEAYYDKENFEKFPKNEAHAYGDLIFAKMMFAKVISVQLVNSLGYDVLFQDVDVVWYRDPLAVFHDNSHAFSKFDMIFQYDGARSLGFVPYSANTGFYYVRYNDNTQYMLVSLLYKGEIIMRSKSHQQALIAVLVESASLFGLRVKIIPLEDTGFPGGWHYHRKKDQMKEIAQEKIIPTIFHMSWTENKKNKLLFMKQMGMWHLQEQCVDKTVEQILGATTSANKSADQGQLDGFCCSKEPIITCHYRDKPSKIPCKDSPSIDKGHASFW